MLGIAPGHADQRVALVIGNSTYRTAAGLPNSTNDAIAVSNLFKLAQFDTVRLELDLGVADLRRTINDFAEVAADADIAVVYYAGHGIEMDGTNYLIPIDARLVRDLDVDDEALTLDRVLRAIEPARRLRLVILDACRDNPFVTTMKRSLASRSIGRGLARIESAPSDTLIAFSAKAGSVALDGAGGYNSPFTSALLRHLTTPNLDIRLAFGRVRDDVLQSTNRKQEPFVYGSLGGDAISFFNTTPLEAAPSENVQSKTREAAEAWIATKDTNSEAMLAAFVRHYEGTYYADLARVRIQELRATTPPIVQPSATAVTVRKAQKIRAQKLPEPTHSLKAVQRSSAMHLAPAEQPLRQEPPPGVMTTGARFLVNDGTCGPGQIKEIVAGSIVNHIPRQRRCIPH